MNNPPNGQKSRSLATQTAMMEAAESLIADSGIQNVSIKDIVRAAGQKNESALQYHFGNLQGLIDAIHVRRTRQTQATRADMLNELESKSDAPTLRQLCELMVYPTFLLARSDPQFRVYVAAFSHEIVLAEDSALTRVNQSGGGGESGNRLGEMLRSALPELDEPAYRIRMDLAIRMCSAAMGNYLRQKNPLKGAAAEHFVNSLIDALVGLLSAPVSRETKKAKPS